ncbi:MAG: glycosyltransferase family 4 protein [Gammaproteobacteria bacterium]|nr:glycosyltransferase family 4 protein [Gammaproteobacteria bacterium]
MSLTDKRILIVSHGHPDFNKGGAELAAYNMYQALRRQGVDAWFLARTDMMPHGGAAFSTRGDEREILFHTTMDDFFLFSNINTRHLWADFRELLQRIQPDVVHFHHYIHFGIEALKIVKTTLPASRLVLTLHEYLAICRNGGQMITTDTKPKLCYGASTTDCHRCFPKHSPADFYLRERYLKAFFELVDAFVSPSQFLKQRYVDWGIPANSITVIENGQPPVSKPAFRYPVATEGKVHLAYFGQINPFKGLHVLFSALDFLPKKLRKKLHIDVHGANLESQESSYQKELMTLFKKNKDIIDFHGRYEARELYDIMKDVDWVVMTSIWWENSPMVIQEAFNYGRPLLVSDIGGMAEKVEDGRTGLHFRAGKPASLAHALEKIINNPALRDEFAANITPPLSIDDCLQRHLPLYEQRPASAEVIV